MESLNLAKLLEKDGYVQTELCERGDMEANRKFLKLIPSVDGSKRGILWNFKMRFKVFNTIPISKKALGEILEDNGLVKKGSETSQSIEEALRKEFHVRNSGYSQEFYKFVEVEDRTGNLLYKFSRFYYNAL